MIKFKTEGDLANTEKALRKMGRGFTKNQRFISGVKRLGEEGVKALREATPKDTGKTAESWSYEIIPSQNDTTFSVVWKNSNYNKWANIAVLIQYGHATSSGYWIEGVDYINPALKPIFEKLADEAWQEVTVNADR